MKRSIFFLFFGLLLFGGCKSEPAATQANAETTSSKKTAPTNKRKSSVANLIGFKGSRAVTSTGKVLDIPGLTDEKQSTFFLVRHAEKKSGENPELTDVGLARAAKLAALLDDLKIDQVMSTDYNRTKATVTPLAKAKDLAVQSYDPSMQKDLFTDLSVFNKQNVVVVGHSNTIPQLANVLIGKEIFSDFSDDDYSQLIIISLSQPGMATYEQFLY